LNAAQERVAQWLARRIAGRKGLAGSDIGWRQPFGEFGLASLELVALAVELGVWLGQEVETTLLFNHPDIEQVAQALTEPPPSEDGTPGVRPVARQEPIAIVGMACRFPGAPDAEAFWNLLQRGDEAITDVPAWRWGNETFAQGEPQPGKAYVRRAGFIDGVDEFDPAFFGISAREARMMDPQHRLVLMTAWHALEDAAIPPQSLAGSRTGVFVGIGVSDYYGLMEQADVDRDAYFAIGVAAAIASNRLSYLLDLRGPSLSIDTTCSSSLVALHQARASLLSGESGAAIVAGVNVIVCPGGMVTLSQSRMLSPTARCHTFDEKADGYVRGEGCGVVVLKRFSDALKDGDRIHALIAGTAVNQDGRSAGLTVPNGEAQARLMRDALAAAALPPGRVSYLEAHGTGTPLGDPIEIGAIKQVYGKPCDDEPVLYIGSAKTNVGHLEAAAGMVGLFKVVLAMRHQEIPAHRNFEAINPRIMLEGTRCEITTQPVGWPMSLRPRYAGVSSFGIGGTNAHAVLQDAPPTDLLRAPAEPVATPGVFVLSAHEAETLVAQAKRHAECLANTEVSWPSLCHTAAARRAHHPHRLAVVCSDAADAALALARWAEGHDAPEVLTGFAPARPTGKLAFLFTGQGAQYVGMGHALYRHHAGFLQALQQCDALFLPWLGQSVIALLYPQGETEGDLSQTLHAQPALFSLEYALAQVWLQAGVKPDVLLGHSLGEYVAATIAGVFSLEDAVRLVAHRARLMQEAAPPGAMAAVHAAPELIDRLLAAPRPASVALAARNTPQEIVMSGEEAALNALLAPWRAAGAAVTPLHVTRAFHSPLMQGMSVEFARVAQTVAYQAPGIALISNLSGRTVGDEIATADYWVRHTLEPVAFCEGVAAAHALGCTRFVEIGPHPVLSAAVRQMQPEVVTLPSLRRGRDALESLLEVWARWHVEGGVIDWHAAQRHASGGENPSVASLPPYAFRRDRHWFRDATSPAPARQVAPEPAQEDPLRIALQALPQRSVEVVGPLVQDFLLRRLSAALRLTETQEAALSPTFGTQPLAALGLDSLLAVELRHAVLQTVGVAVPTARLLDGTPIADIAGYIAKELVRGGAGPDAKRTTWVSQPGARFEPFALSAYGRANWEAARGTLPNELYVELELDESAEAFEASWQRLVDRHDMLRAVVQDDGCLRVLREVPAYRVPVADLTGLGEAQAEEALQQTRREMIAGALDSSRWPLFELRASRLGATLRMHMRFSVLIVDTHSLGVLAAERACLRDDPAGDLPPVEITYRDCRENLRRQPVSEASRAHWASRLAEMPPPPAIEQKSCSGDYTSLRAELGAGDWAALKAQAMKHGLTASSVLLAVYADVLRQWSGCDVFSIGVVAASRPQIHPQIEAVVGDFATLLPLAVHAVDGIALNASRLQARLAEDMDNLAGVDAAATAAPFLFNSMLATADTSVAYSLTRGAGTRIEMQAVEDEGRLVFNWDVHNSTFVPGAPQAHFELLHRGLERLVRDPHGWHLSPHAQTEAAE
jgi:acyl transferase domain-containing protein